MIIVTKVNTNHSSRFVLKTQYNTSKSSVGKKIDADKEIPGTSGIVKKKAGYNAKITEIEGRIPRITS